MSVLPQIATGTLGDPAGVAARIGDLERQVATLYRVRSYIGDGSIGSGMIGSGAILATHIETGTINAGHIETLSINAGHMQADSITVTNAALENAVVQTAKIADAAIKTAKIDDAQIITAKIADAQITTAKIVDANITTAKIGDAQITTAKIVDANITTAKIGLAQITTGHIQDAQITTAKIGSAQIQTAHIQDAQITSAKIGLAEVKTANIMDANITNAKIGNLAVDNTKIADATITTAKIGDAQITTAKIGDAQITNLKVANIDGDKINANTMTADRLVATSVSADTLLARLTHTGSLVASTGLSAVSARVGSLVIDTTFGGSILVGSPGGARIVTDNTGITGYSDATNISFKLAAGSGKVTTLGGIGGPNMLKNSGFENGLVDWSQEQPTVTSSTAQFRFGTKSFLLTAGANGYSVARSVAVDILGGRDYTLSSWFYLGTANTARLQIQWHNAGGVISNVDVGFTNPINTWQRNSVVGTAPSNATFVTVAVYILGANGNTAYIDGAQLEEGSLLTAYGPKPDEILPGTVTPSMLSVNNLAALVANIGVLTIEPGGLIRTGVSPNPRVEIGSGGIIGYSDATKVNFALDAVTGKVTTLAGIGGPNKQPFSALETQESLNSWLAYGGASANPAVYTADRRSGSGCLSITYNNAGGYPHLYIGPTGVDGWRMASVSPGQKITASFYAKAVTGSLSPTGGPYIDWYTDAGVYVSTTVTYTAGEDAGNGWKRYFSTYTVPATARYGRMLTLLFNMPTNPSQILFDNPQIEEGDLVTAWSAMPEEILANAVGANQLADNSVTALAIANDAVGNTEIATDAVQSGEIATNAIRGSEQGGKVHILADSIGVTELQVTTLSAITANMGTLTAGRISGGTIDGNVIDAGSIRADQLTVGAVNGLRNGGFEDRAVAADYTVPAGWRKGYHYGTAGAADSRRLDSAIDNTWKGVYIRSGDAGLYIAGGGVAGYSDWASEPMPVNPGDVYTLSFYAKSHNGAVPGFFIGMWGGLEKTTNAHQVWLLNNAAISTTWAKYSFQWVVPANVNWAHIDWLVYDAGVFSVDDMTFRKTSGGTDIVDGAITTTKLTADWIEAKSFRTGSGATRLESDVSGIRAYFNSVQTVGIDAATGSITATKGTITGATLRTSATNPRIEMDATTLTSYDVNGNIGFRLSSGNVTTLANLGSATIPLVSNSVDSAQIVTGAVKGTAAGGTGEIAAGTISATEIEATSIRTAILTANSITAGMLTVGIGGFNVLGNSSFEDPVSPTAHWGLYQNGGSGASFTVISSANAIHGTKIAQVTAGTSNSNVGICSPYNTGSNTVAAGKPYTWSFWVIASGAAKQIQAHINWYDSVGNNVPGGAADSVVSVPSNVWTRIKVTATPPAGATRAYPYAWENSPANGSVCYYDAMQLQDGDYASHYQPKNIQDHSSAITETLIAPGSISTGKIQANAVTANEFNAVIGGANLIPNPLFTAGSGGLDSWIAGAGTWIVEPNIGSGVGGTERGVYTQTAGNPHLYCSTVKAVPGRKMTLSCWAYGTYNRECILGFLWYTDAAGSNPLFTGASSGLVPSGWTRLEHTTTAPGGYTHMRAYIQFIGTGGNPETSYFAAPQLEEGDVATTFKFGSATGTFTGGTFRTATSGARVEMTPAGITKYDAAEAIPVQLGATDGLDLLASTLSSPPNDRRIRWKSGASSIGSIHHTDSIGGSGYDHRMQIVTKHRSGDTGIFGVEQQAHNGSDAILSRLGVFGSAAGGGGVFAGAGTDGSQYSKTIINSDGFSSFASRGHGQPSYPGTPGYDYTGNLLNSFFNYGAGFCVPTATKYGSGFTKLQGMVGRSGSTAAGTSIMYLQNTAPVLDNLAHIFVCASNLGMVRVDLTGDGYLNYQGPTGTLSWLSLDTIGYASTHTA